MGSFTDRKTLMRCIEQLKEKVVVDQHYSHLKEVRQECFDCNKFCFLFFVFFCFFSMTSRLTLDHVINK